MGKLCRFLVLFALLTAAGWLLFASQIPAADRASRAPAAPVQPAASQPGPEDKPAAASTVEGNRYALLVGCTRYYHLEKHDLDGPANDVLLMREVLTSKFGFPEKNIVLLAEGRGAELLPIRQNIEREFRALADKAKPDDQIVILLAGHGAQQPERDPPPDPENVEPDGLDETFLPADTKVWDPEQKTCPNAIIDDEFREWTNNIVKKGAFLWFIADSCHSGSLLRAPDKVREVTMEDLGIPDQDISTAEDRAARRGGGVARGLEAQPPFKLGEKSGRLVALYAAQPQQTTVELRFTRDEDPRGLLSYTLCEVLTQNTRAMTYRELGQRIRDEYEAMGRTFPTPLIEGTDLDRKVLAMSEEVFAGRSRLRLAPGEDEGTWKVTGGRLNGLTRDSVLSLHPPGGEKDQVLGHMRITESRLTEADVVPCEYNNVPAPKELQKGWRCEPAYIDYGDLRLPVAAGVLDDGKRGARSPGQEAAGRQLEEQLKKIEEDKHSLIHVVPEPRDAKWLALTDGGQVYLQPSQGVKMRDGAADSPLFGPFAADEHLAATIKDRLQRIARAQNLLKLAPDNGLIRGSAGIQVQLRMLRFRSRDDEEGEAVEWQANGIALKEGDLIGFEVGVPKGARKRVYATLLFIDSGYGITALYPQGGDVAEMLEPGHSVRTGKFKVSSKKTRGPERVVVIAVKAGKSPVDFTWLDQPSIERARDVVMRERGDEDQMKTPLAQLLQNAAYGESGQRGLDDADIDSYASGMISWNTLPPATAGAGK